MQNPIEKTEREYRNYGRPLLASRVGVRQQRHFLTGGERGIRTPGTPLWAYTRFPVVLLKPLGHLSSLGCVIWINQNPDDVLMMLDSGLRNLKVIYDRNDKQSIFISGGERGIRTPVGACDPQIDFESIPLRPLRYLSADQYSVEAVTILF
jgi:hypothetical protein